MKTGKWHAGITTHQVRVGDGVGVPAAVIAMGIVAILLLGIPDFWVFPAGSAAFGIALAIWVSHRGLGSVPLSLNATQAGAPFSLWQRLIKSLLCGAAAITVGVVVAKIVFEHLNPGAYAPESDTALSFFYRPVLIKEWFGEWQDGNPLPSFQWENPLIWWFLGCAVLLGVMLALILRVTPRANRITSLSWAAESVNTQE
ncbi:MAG TPA: hypothetical protein VF532_07485 [Candidatus Angelobacter sp.]